MAWRHLHRVVARLSLSWSLRNGVARARHLGRAAATPMENFFINKGGRGRAMQRVWSRSQRLFGLLAFCAFSLLSLFFLASLGLFLSTLGLEFTNTHIKVPTGRRFKQFMHFGS
ncbi:hypothetical protein PIB30_100325 [Stylosanthes scabra]|uniref:Uncharacterized protein n=1 Tax=Stylosanthes scabra TaxID=79078 RepID=A0ABU6QY58_9FABA|nr:hypothetical protein [Stylosanthes scabra]